MSDAGVPSSVAPAAVPSAGRHSTASVNTQWLRLDAAFMPVDATARAESPLKSKLSASSSLSAGCADRPRITSPCPPTSSPVSYIVTRGSSS